MESGGQVAVDVRAELLRLREQCGQLARENEALRDQVAGTRASLRMAFRSFADIASVCSTARGNIMDYEGR